MFLDECIVSNNNEIISLMWPFTLFVHTVVIVLTNHLFSKSGCHKYNTETFVVIFWDTKERFMYFMLHSYDVLYKNTSCTSLSES